MTKIAIGADEAGFGLKEKVKDFLVKNGYEVEDYGVYDTQPVLYPDIAFKVATAIAQGKHKRGILICGTGIGMAIMANKVPGVRAAVCHDPYSTERSRKSNDAQIMTMGARVIGEELAKTLVSVWLQSEFQGGGSTSKVERINYYDDKLKINLKKSISPKKERKIFWQAHRGGGAHEAPDNTMTANRYAWGLEGIPENDVRATKDEVIICLHDDTPARTTTAPDAVKDRSISTFTYDEVRQWDAGIKFDPKYQGEKVPTIEELFAEMSGHPERQAYLDLKNIDLKELGRLIDKYHVNHQIIFCHNNQDNCIKMKEIAAGVRTMLWVGGKPEKIKEKFEIILQNGFKGLDQVQFHLNPDAERPNDRWLYEIGEEYVRYAMALTAQYNVQFQVLPYQFDQKDISRLLDMGIDWYATDEPARFMECVKNWRNSQD